MPKFIQITANQYSPYALDETGQVWKYEEQTRRVCPDNKHFEHSCEYQTVGYWQPLSQQCGFFGWPLTEQEVAEAEVERLLH